jgi:DNA polymerase-3 subunit epsilon
VNWRTSPIAIIDTETTGVDHCVARIVEVAIRIVRPGGASLAKSWLVNPGVDIPAEVIAIHGITDEMIRDAPTFAELADEIRTLVSGCIPTAYNAKYDRSILIAEYLRAQRDAPCFLRNDQPWIDVLAWARAHEPYAKGKGRHKLGNVAARLGVGIGTAHRAAGDCETTASVLEKLSAVPRLMPEALDDLHMQQRVLNAKNEAGFLEWLAKQPKEAI